ncbi:ABC transporter permease [Brevundimonas sp. BAL450]|uniref:ABC transporter permease n=1 Tax=Brevundimonas sp. BAL450 TaxID=1708162 RepID=UPI0018C8EF33|nr:ABC transporter permease [Brevundimonas sp. BAL450]MBG7615246.1 ABC transporter permease [Brevundimonas sp. BAL450]
MKRALLIARREYLAYARTVGFWLSLLALPFFAVLGGSVPFLMERSEPISQVVLVEAPGEGPSLTAAVRAAMDRAVLGRQAQALRAAARIEAGPEAADGVRDVAEREGYEAGLAELRRVAPQAAAGFSTPRERIRIIDPTPADLTELASAPDPAAVLAPWFEGERLPGEVQLDSAVILNRADGAPSAVVWSRRATDDTVEDAVRAALVEVNRREALTGAGLADTVVDDVQRFRPQVQMFSPASVSGGEVSLRDRLPGIIGLALGFLLWSLVVTGASMLMNSVMEEKANKVMEVLMSSASSAEILAGKVLGVAALTGTVLLAWGAMGAAGFAALIPEIGADVAAVLMKDGLLLYLFAYLAGGYLMYAVMFAAIGAFCETPREAQTLIGPIMMILIVPLLVMQMAMRNPDAMLVKVLSWVPLFTPFLMSARAPSGPPLVEIIGTMAGMLVTVVVITWLAGRAFRAGALSGVKLEWKSLGRVLKREG